MAYDLRSHIIKTYPEIKVNVQEYCPKEGKKTKIIISVIVYFIAIFFGFFKIWSKYLSFIGEKNIAFINKIKHYPVAVALLGKPIIFRFIGVNQEGAFEVKYNDKLIYSGLKEHDVPGKELIVKLIEDIRNKDK